MVSLKEKRRRSTRATSETYPTRRVEKGDATFRYADQTRGRHRAQIDGLEERRFETLVFRQEKRTNLDRKQRHAEQRERSNQI